MNYAILFLYVFRLFIALQNTELLLLVDSSVDNISMNFYRV